MKYKKTFLVAIVLIIGIIILKSNIEKTIYLENIPYDLENAYLNYERVIYTKENPSESEVQDIRIVEKRYLERDRYEKKELHGNIEYLENRSFDLSKDIEIPNLGEYIAKAGLKLNRAINKSEDYVFMCYLSRDIIEQSVQLYNDKNELINSKIHIKACYYPHIEVLKPNSNELEYLLNCVDKNGFDPIYTKVDKGFNDFNAMVEDANE